MSKKFNFINLVFICDCVLPEYQWEYPGDDRRCWHCKHKHLHCPGLQARPLLSRPESDLSQPRPGPATSPPLSWTPSYQVRIIETPWLQQCSTLSLWPVKYITLVFIQLAAASWYICHYVNQKIILDSVSYSDISLFILLFSGFDCNDSCIMHSLNDRIIENLNFREKFNVLNIINLL